MVPEPRMITQLLRELQYHTGHCVPATAHSGICDFGYAISVHIVAAELTFRDVRTECCGILNESAAQW